VDAAAADDEDIAISSSPPRKRRLDSKESEEAQKTKARPVRSSNTLRANANAHHGSDESGEDMDDVDSPATPSFNGRRVLSTTGKTSTTSSRKDNYLLEDLHLQHSKLESRFLKPLLVATQRQSEILKQVVEKQKKIIRGLRRRHASDQVRLL
jgi:hypothetical protein